MIPTINLICEKCGAHCFVEDPARREVLTHSANGCDLDAYRWSVWIDPQGFIRVDQLTKSTVIQEFPELTR